MKHRISSSLFFLLPFSVCLAQEPESESGRDSVKTYRLGEVVITSEEIRRVSPVTVEQVTPAEISRLDATTVGELTRAIAGARLQTNSRGESLIYIRNAGERQVGLFFDGVLMNVPWDYRLDMSLIPANVVGGVTVSKGAPSVLYGVNVLGGAVNIVTQELSSPGSLTEVSLIGGENRLMNASLVQAGYMGDFNYIATLARTHRSGIPLPADADLPFNQADPDVRTNTDLSSTSLYARGEYRFSPSLATGLSVNYIDAQKGVAPESHKPDSLGPRFWRYPDWTNMTVTLNGELAAGADHQWDLRWALWSTRFHQAIDQFQDGTYTLRSARQEDNDLTLGARAVLRRELGTDHSIDLALNGLQSTHRQMDLSYADDGTLEPYTDVSGNEAPYPELTYRQQLYSVGAEYNGAFDRLHLMAGLGYDGMTTPLSGDKPSYDPLGDISASFGASYSISSELLVRGSVGRKTRFPSMRELYGEALNRFLINPDLKPENAILTELGGGINAGWGEVSLVGFGTFTSNTIDQKNVTTPNGRKRQRINLEGSRTLGVELTGSVVELRPFRLDGHLTWAHTRGLVADSDSTFNLSEKPEMIAALNAQYDFPFGLQPAVELLYTGQAYSLNDDNEMVPLGASAVLNLRLAYRFTASVGSGLFSEIFVRANNVTDQLVTPQLGLPGAGRELQAGIKLSY